MDTQTKPNKTFENVIIISLDCIRREALGCYSQQFPWRSRFLSGSHTPNIDQLCAGGHRFEQAITHAPFTPAAHASLFTSLIPPKHGLRKFLGVEINESIPTLAQTLSDHGWQCGAVVGAQALSRDFGLDKGFDYYDDDIQSGHIGWLGGQWREAHEVTDQATNWLDTINEQKPFFLFAHYFDAHNIAIGPAPEPSESVSNFNNFQSVTPPKRGFRQKLRDALPEAIQTVIKPVDQTIRSGYYAVKRSIYAGLEASLSYFEAGGKYKYEGRRFMLNKISSIDTQIGRLIQAVSEQGKLDKTLIVILADHGDDFMEHGEPTHRRYLYDTTLVVPLIIYPTITTQKIIPEQVRLIDIYPTVLSAVGISTEADIDGQSLFTFNNEPSINQPREAYAETIFEVIQEDRETDVLTCYASLRDYPWKLIWNRLNNTYELYHIQKDPHETKNLAYQNETLVETMASKLHIFAQDMPSEKKPTDDIIVERLEALGYL